MTRGDTRVIKLGGSLLDWPELAPQLRQWLSLQTPRKNLLIVGGGAIVDALRQLDQRQHLPDDAAHWLAIRAMSLTASLVAQLLPEAGLATTLDQWRASDNPLCVLDVEAFLRDDEQSSARLPHGWQVTSDSIAARVATVVEADELVLLKSALPPSGAKRVHDLAAAGYVDPWFARAAQSFPLRCVNLRDEEFAQTAVAT